MMAGAALSALVGCMTTTDTPAPSEHLAAYAASTNYPSVKAEQSTEVGVTIEPSSKTLRVLNFGQKSIDNCEVWLNGTFVYKVDTIPGDGYVTLREADFYDRFGHSYADTQSTPSRIELRYGDHLWTMLGPIVQ